MALACIENPLGGFFAAIYEEYATSTLQSAAASAVAHSAATSDGSKMKLLKEVSNREIS